MRERLTLSFIVLAVVLLAGVLAVRSYSLQGMLREHESDELHQSVAALSVAVEQRQVLGLPVDAGFLSGLVGEDTRLVFTPAEGDPVVVTGSGYSSDGDDDLRVSDEANGDELTLEQSGEVVADMFLDDLRPLGMLILLVVLLSGIFGFLISRAMAQPFRKLAIAAGALGRGRFDLDLPTTRIPEARAIATALASSADQLQERLHREQEFAEHASHVLRTPLTGLRLELEELTLRPDLPEDARGAAARGLAGVEEVNRVAGELVELARRGALVEGAEIPLRDLATLCAQRWADELADHDRVLTAAVEGDIELTYTPGPVEQILELLLVDVVRRGEGAVRMVFDGDPGGHLKIRVMSAGDPRVRRTAAMEPPVEQARAVVLALGGRMQGQSPMEGIEILLPRR